MRQFKSLILDLVLIALATSLALVLRDNLEFSALRQGALLPYLLITVATALVVLPLAGINKTIWRFSGLRDYWRLIGSCAAIVMIAVLVGFATLRLDNVPRSLPVIQGILMVAFLVGTRVLMRARRLRRGNQITQAAAATSRETVLLVGLNTVAELFIQAVSENPGQGISIAGVIGRNERHTGQLFRGHPIRGTPEEITRVLGELDVHGVKIDRIVVTLPIDRISPDAQDALSAIEDGKQIRVDYFSERLGFGHQSASQFVNRSAIMTDGHRHAGRLGGKRAGADEQELLEASRRTYWKIKRSIDLGLASLLLLSLAPLMLVIGLLTAIAHGLPVMFWQQRPGKGGTPFKVYKFRSLLGAHDEMGQRLPDHLRETWLGRLMRATRLDELPQLVNIARGHMSFVGPRPLLVNDQLDQFSGRLLVRPGLTGWAQVNGGKSISASDKMALDVWYIKHASLTLDIKILLMTVHMVVIGERQNPEAVERAWIELNRGKA